MNHSFGQVLIHLRALVVKVPYKIAMESFKSETKQQHYESNAQQVKISKNFQGTLFYYLFLYFLNKQGLVFAINRH